MPKLNKPFGQIAVRLCDVSPTGSSYRITYGVLSLKFAQGMDTTKPLPLNTKKSIRIELDHIAYALPKGHKLRLSLSNAYWPLIWPEPDSAEIEILEGTLSLPIRKRSHNEWVFPEPITAIPWKHKNIRKPSNKREIVSDCATGTTKVIVSDDFGSNIDLENDLVISSKAREEWSIHPDEPLSAYGKTHWTEERSRGEWSIKTETYSKMTSDNNYFYLEAKIEAYENDEIIYKRDMKKKIKRKF